MHLWIMPVSIFVSRLDIIVLANKINIYTNYTNLTKLFNFKI